MSSFQKCFAYSKAFENAPSRRGTNRLLTSADMECSDYHPRIEPSLSSDDGRSSEPSPQEIEAAAP